MTHNLSKLSCSDLVTLAPLARAITTAEELAPQHIRGMGHAFLVKAITRTKRS